MPEIELKRILDDELLTIAKNILGTRDGIRPIFPRRGESIQEVMEKSAEAQLSADLILFNKLKAELTYWKEKHFNDVMSAKKSGWDDCEKFKDAEITQLKEDKKQMIEEVCIKPLYLMGQKDYLDWTKSFKERWLK